MAVGALSELTKEIPVPMSNLPTAMRNRIATYLAGAGAPAAISGVFLDLYNGDPQASGTSVLATLSGSATRPNITSSLGAAANGVVTSTAVVTPFASAAAAATVTHFALFDAATGGNLIASGPMSTGTQSLNAGNGFQFNAGTITLSSN